MRKVLARKVLGGRSHFFGEKSTCGEGSGREKPLLWGEKYLRGRFWDEKNLRGRFWEGEATSSGEKSTCGEGFVEGEATSSVRKVLAEKVLGGRRHFFERKVLAGKVLGG